MPAPVKCTYLNTRTFWLHAISSKSTTSGGRRCNMKKEYFFLHGVFYLYAAKKSEMSTRCPTGYQASENGCLKIGSRCESTSGDGHIYMVTDTGACVQNPNECLPTHLKASAHDGSGGVVCVLIGSECTDTSGDGFKYAISETGECVKGRECLDTHAFVAASAECVLIGSECTDTP